MKWLVTVFSAVCFLSFLVSCSSGEKAVDGGRYLLLSKASGFCLDVSGNSRDKGVPIIQWEVNEGAKNSPNQVWKLKKVTGTGENVYKLFVESTSFCLDVEGLSTNNSARIVQWPENGNAAANQLWSFERSGGYYKIRSKVSNKLLTIGGIATEKGVNLTQFEELPGSPDNQLWKLIRAK